MFLSVCVLAGLALPAATPPVLPPAPANAAAATDDHGKLPWFEGTWDELLAEAQRSNKIIFIDFWADWCGWCKKLDKDTFTDDAVVAEMSDMLVFSVDSESDTGKPLAEKFGVSGLPALFFLEPDGEVRDKISGYMPPEPFIAEVARIKSGKGTLAELKRQVAADANDIALRYELALKLQDFGDMAGYEEQMAKIKELDPEGKSLPMRRMAFGEVWAGVRENKLETAPILEFLAAEQHPEMLFDGWGLMSQISDFKRRDAIEKGDLAAAKTHLEDYITYAQKQWSYVPADAVAGLGNNLGWTLYELREELSHDQLAWALDVARQAVKASEEKDPSTLDTFACLQFATGDRAGAIKTLELCVRLDPEEETWKERLAEFKTAL